MLNLGQVVYDTTNKRVLIYGGFVLFQEKECGQCRHETNFLTEELEELRFGTDNKVPFKYVNFDRGLFEPNEVPMGVFVKAAEVYGCYFGCLDFEKILAEPHLVDAIKDTFKAAKEWKKPEPAEAAAGE